MDGSTDPYTTYRFAFESCRSYDKRERSISKNDFAAVCRSYNLHYEFLRDALHGPDPDGRILLDSFLYYMKRFHNGHYDYVDEYRRPMSPTPRPHSGNKPRQQHYVSHHYRHSPRYPPTSPTGHYDQDNFAQEEAQPLKRPLRRPEMSRDTREVVNRTPDAFMLSPDADRSRAGRERMRPTDYDHIPPDLHTHHRTHLALPRGGADSPPPPPSHLVRYPRTDRSEKAKSTGGRDEDSDDGSMNGDYYQLPPPSRRSCKRCRAHQRQVKEIHEDLKATRMERERLEQTNERLRTQLQKLQSADHAYAQLYRENERLRQEIKRLRKETDPESDKAYFDRQYEELKKMKDDLEEEALKERATCRAYKRECSALKAEYNNLKLKNEEFQRHNWQLTDENQRLHVRLMEEDRNSLYSRRPGDGGSEEHSARSSYASNDGFQRTAPMRQTYHHANRGRAEVTRDSSSRPRKGRVEMKRTSSAGQALDYDVPVKEEKHDNYTYKAAQSYKSAPSEASDGLGLQLVSTTPDEQSQVFMVMGEDVSKSVLPEGLQSDEELAMMYSLQNCHSVQELIKCLVSYGISSSTNRLEGFRVENDHLKSLIEHLKAKNTTLAESFETAKGNMEAMYYRTQKVEANNTRLLHSLNLCQTACEAFEVLLDLKQNDPRSSGSNPNYFPSFEYNSLETRSPDREQAPVRHSVVSKVRYLLHVLDANTELQTYLPGVRPRRGSGDYHHTAHWAGTLSQNTGTTSGLSSMSSGIEGEITAGEVDRLKQYTQALLMYQDHLSRTLVQIDGLKGLQTVKSCEAIKDCLPSDRSGEHIVDLEDAANAEELCKVREEKAELRSQIYMMEQEKRRMELEVSRMLLHKRKCDRVIFELQKQLEEERKRKKKEKKRKGDPSVPHDRSHMSELSIEYQSTLERERELARRYDDLFTFMQLHVKDSQDTCEQLMLYVKDLRRANTALVDAFEKSKKRQQAEKRKMKQELVAYMNRIQGNSVPNTSEEPTNGTVYA